MTGIRCRGGEIYQRSVDKYGRTIGEESDETSVDNNGWCDMSDQTRSPYGRTYTFLVGQRRNMGRGKCIVGPRQEGQFQRPRFAALGAAGVLSPCVKSSSLYVSDEEARNHVERAAEGSRQRGCPFALFVRGTDSKPM